MLQKYVSAVRALPPATWCLEALHSHMPQRYVSAAKTSCQQQPGFGIYIRLHGDRSYDNSNSSQLPNNLYEPLYAVSKTAQEALMSLDAAWMHPIPHDATLNPKEGKT